MNETTYKMWNKKKFIIYLICTFSIAWVMQVVASKLAIGGNMAAFQMILAVSMFAPMLGALIAKAPFKTMGWLPRFKADTKNTIVGFLAAWFLPAVLTVLGAILYFVIFPNRFDTTGQYLAQAAGQAGMEQLEAMGITPVMYALIGAIQAITFAPFINMFFALGEEAGWRGFMQPMLKERLGRVKGNVISGIIWGAWHWPVMILAGYEYGLVYWGAPFLGMALFCFVCVVLGIVMDGVYEKTGCIWAPALAHGAFNAIATLPVMFLNMDYADQLTVGPAPIGIISLIPMLIAAVMIMAKKPKNE